MGVSDNLDSLLTIEWYKGGGFVSGATFELTEEEQEKFGAVCEVKLWRMKFVFIQAQIMALVEYVNDGVFGVLFPPHTQTRAQTQTQTVPSPSPSPTTPKTTTLVKVKTEKFEILLPQSAFAPEKMSLSCGSINLSCQLLGDVIGNVIEMHLSDVVFDDVVKNPVNVR